MKLKNTGRHFPGVACVKNSHYLSLSEVVIGHDPTDQDPVVLLANSHLHLPLYHVVLHPEDTGVFGEQFKSETGISGEDILRHFFGSNPERRTFIHGRTCDYLLQVGNPKQFQWYTSIIDWSTEEGARTGQVISMVFGSERALELVHLNGLREL